MSYIYCFIRKDLPFVQQIIQMSHACFEMGAIMECPNTPNIVLFEVCNEKELHKVISYLTLRKISHVPFRDSDINNELTAICTEIVETKEKRAIFKDFKLYK